MNRSSPRRHWQRERKLPPVFIDRSKPMTKRETLRLATTSSFKDLQQLNEFFVIDPEAMRKRRWKELRHLWERIRHRPGSLGSIENSLWFSGSFKVGIDHFVTAMVHAFKFDDPSLRMDNHLRCLFWTLEEDHQVDWRDVSASLLVLIQYQLVRSDPARLLLRLFDLYASNRSSMTDDQVSSSPTISSQHLLKIFLVPVIEEYDFNIIHEHFKAIMFDFLGFSPVEEVAYNITRSQFELYLHPTESGDRTINLNFMSKWQSLLWDRLPTELRLQVLDYEQLQALRRSDYIAQNALLNRALKFRHIVLLRYCIAEWRLLIANRGTIIAFHKRRRLKYRRDFFLFWFYGYTVPRINKRKKCQLADIIGKYATKLRCFHRIKKHNSNDRRIMQVVGKHDPRVKRIAEGFRRLRRFYKLHQMRCNFHIWWERCRNMINNEIATYHNERRQTLRTLRAWAHLAHELALKRRMDAVALENQINFLRGMDEAQEAAEHLAEVEIDRKKRYAEERAQKMLAEEEKRRMAKAEAIRMENERERDFILLMQREDRLKRIADDMRRMHARHKEKWRVLLKQYIANEVNEAEKYINNKANAIDIQMRFQQTKKDFYAPPNFEYEEREKIIRSFKYIAMLYFYWRMVELDYTVHDMVKSFDKDKKGHLSHDEMHQLLLSLEIPGLSSLQLHGVANEINENENEYITVEKLEKNLVNVSKFGVPGSGWKFYVDPIQNVMLYRNFDTKEIILEHFMTDKMLHTISLANIRGEAVDRARLKATDEKSKDWNILLHSYMARRIQYMYSLWKGRRERKDMLWKVDSRELFASRARERNAWILIERHVAGMVSRLRFRRQLHLTVEKVWDVNSGLKFYHNHQLGTSSWEIPLLLRRFGDVEDPLPWIILHPDRSDLSTTDYNSIAAYYNVPAKKHIPRKPDGWRVCCYFEKRDECSFFATRYCLVCDAVFCFSCHRHEHSNPFGFFQNIKPSPFQRLDPEFIAMITKAQSFHSWRCVETPLPCDLCNAGAIEGPRLAAYVYCTECDKKYCRICNRRVHSHEKFSYHILSGVD